jgi:hypothetical protein
MQPATVFSIIREQAKKMTAGRPALTGVALQRVVSTALKLPPRHGVPEYRIPRPLSGRAYPKRYAATYMVETEPDIHAVVYRFNDAPFTTRPPRGAKRAMLYVSHRSADSELRTEPLIKDAIAAEPTTALFACDVRGVGESQPVLSNRDAFSYGGPNYFHAVNGLMFDYPVAGQRTHDLLRILDWLKDNGHDDVHVIARGWGTIPATFAAVLHVAVTQVTLKHALTSFGAIVESEEYDWPLTTLIPDVLRSFDLPDLYRELATKQLRQIEPVGAGGVPA